jgi:hypothetical protein
MRRWKEKQQAYAILWKASQAVTNVNREAQLVLA